MQRQNIILAISLLQQSGAQKSDYRGHAETIYVPLNLETAFFTTSGFNQFVVNSECQTHFLGPLKCTAVTWGCSCNPNMGIQRKSPATSRQWLCRE